MIAQEPTPRQIRIAILFTAVLQLAILLLQVVTSDVRDYDFLALYAAGQIMHEGRGARLYDLAEQARAENAILMRPGLPVVTHPIIYPPFQALLLAPLARFSYATAYLAWGIINISLWMVFTYLARSIALVPQQTFQYMLLCFAFLPTWSTLVYGQTTLLLLVLYTLTFISLQRHNDCKAGAFLGLGLFKYQLVMPFAVICLLRHKWRLMASFVAVASLLGGVSVLAVGLRGLVAYGVFLVKLVKQPANPGLIPPLASDMPNLRGVLTVLLAGRVAPIWVFGVAGVVSVLVILLTGIWWRRKDRLDGNASLGLMFAAALAVSLMTAFHLHIYDFALLPLAVFLAIGSRQWSRKTAWRTFLNVSIAVLYFPPFYILFAKWNVRYLLFVPVCAFALALFGLLRQPVDNSLEEFVAGTSGVFTSRKDA